MSQQSPDSSAVMAQVFVTLAMISAIVILALGLFVLVGFVVHRTADSPSRRTAAVLVSIGSVIGLLPPILYVVPRIFG